MLQNVLTNILYILITGCGVTLTKYLVTVLNKKIDELQTNDELAKYKQLNGYIDSAQAVVENVVLAVNQTYVDTLKQSGSFTVDAQAGAKDKAIKMAKEMLSKESKEAITVLYNDLDKYLSVVIESIVKQNK